MVGGNRASHCADLWLGKERLLISRGWRLIWASNKRKLPKFCPKCSLPWETVALSLQQGPASPEGQHFSLFHLSGPPKTYLGHYSVGQGPPVLAHLPRTAPLGCLGSRKTF